MRIEIQFLRFAAVMAVVIFHLWPQALHGGYVGVDVFFVVSGYLITAHLMREISQRGKLSFASFYARRAKRILPSALTVLVATFLGVLVLAPTTDWLSFFKQIFASNVFVENWLLAKDSVDYLAREGAASPVQHYWSLSVEEQFYLIWPALLLIAYWFFIKKLDQRKLFLGALTVVGVASLIASVWITQKDPSPAYFVTYARGFEFIAGAILALMVTRPITHNLTRRIVAATGWLAVLASIVFYSSETPFPGYAALLPTLGTVAVIWAGTQSSEQFARFAVFTRPVLYVAGISFAVYLWHWPLIVFAQMLTPQDLNPFVKFGILLATLVLAGLTTKFIENPLRNRVFEKSSSRRVLFVALGSILTVALLAGSAYVVARKTNQLARQVAQSKTISLTSCSGAGSLIAQNHCAGVKFSKLTPVPEFAKGDVQEVVTLECRAKVRAKKPKVCYFGNQESDTTIALIGDSHAMSMFPVVKAVADREGWRLETFVKDGCEFAAPKLAHPTGPEQPSCVIWNKAVAEKLAQEKAPRLVFTSYKTHDDTMYNSEADWIASIRGAWTPLTNRGSRVVAIRDVPHVGPVTDCLIRFPKNPASCTVPMGPALGTDKQVVAAQGFPNAFVVDLNKYICPDEMCPPAIGGVTVWRDKHHITNTYGLTLVPMFEDQLVALGLIPNAS